MQENEATNQRIYNMKFGSVYPLYVTKIEKKGRTVEELDNIIHWLTGYTKAAMRKHIENQTSFKEFFENAPQLNPNRILITGVICGVRVEDISDETVRLVRYLDKLVDELAKGRAMEKILRK